MRSLIISVLFSSSAFATLNVPVKVIGGDSGSFTPKPGAKTVIDAQKPDVVVVGGGLAGLSAAVYLTDQKLKVLIVEKESAMGGLASSGSDGGRIYDRGAAYWTPPYEEEKKILDHIGIKDIDKTNLIYDPIDSYLVRGQFYNDVWAEETLARLPASFAVFHNEILVANSNKQIPDQPLEEAEKTGYTLELDELTTKEWLERMPALLAQRVQSGHGTPDEAALLQRFETELAGSHLPGPTGMQDLVDFLDLYCRSALGSTSGSISALAFANFYISEIGPRYTSPYGTGLAAKNMVAMLGERHGLARMLTGAAVTKIATAEDGVTVSYTRAGITHQVRAKYAVYAAQLKLAPQVVEGLSERAPEQAKTIESLKYAHYSVHVLLTDGHPYRASYDTWVRGQDYTDNDFTDVILGRWMDPAFKGYENMRSLDSKTPDNNGVLTIYNPLPPEWIQKAYSDDQAKQIALHAADRLLTEFSELPSTLWRTPKIKRIETSRWPYAVHIPEPGHYREKARVLRKPFGRVYFANNNIGTPAFEEALFRGHCAADNVLKRLRPNFRFEDWTRCPAED